MELILLIVLAILLILCIVIAIFTITSKRRANFRNDVHITGGADIETGQITADNNYFKGITDDFSKTVVVGCDFRDNSAIKATIHNLENDKYYNVNISGSLFIGRAEQGGAFTVAGDNLISKQHCRLFVSENTLFLCDNQSLNHTYLNERLITNPVKCHSNDIIRIGNTRLELIF